MTSKYCTMLIVVLWVAACLVPSRSEAVDLPQYKLQLSLSLSAQDEVSGNPKIQRLKATTQELINLARGRRPDAEVPANEVLRLQLNCAESTGLLVVADANNHLPIVTVGTIDQIWMVYDVKQSEGVGVLELSETGDEFNGLRGGFLVLAFKAKAGEGNCPAKIQAGVTGVIEAVTTDDIGTEESAVVVPKGKLKATWDVIDND